MLTASAYLTNRLILGDGAQSLFLQGVGLTLSLLQFSILASLLICYPILLMLIKFKLSSRAQLSLACAVATGFVAILVNEYGAWHAPLFGIVLGTSSGLFAYRGLHVHR